VDEPVIRIRTEPDGATHVQLYGRWDLRSIGARSRELMQQLVQSTTGRSRWDLTRVDAMDAAGAALLWRVWDRRRPAGTALKPEDEWMFDVLAGLPAATLQRSPRDPAWPLVTPGRTALSLASHGLAMLQLLGAVAIDGVTLLRNPAAIPWREISATIYRTGAQALPIAALVGLLIGIVLSYLSGQQLRDFGADLYVVNLMGIGILRELGPLLAAILNAGRSGSSMTAQLGVMRVTEELDAMSVMGLSHTLRLVLPRIVGQLIALPLVVVWTDVLALIGGMIGASLELGIGYADFVRNLPQVVPIANLWLGLGKGAVFGALVALVACHFGLRIRPDTESVAAGTTQAVVTAITMVLLADAMFAVLFAHVGL